MVQGVALSSYIPLSYIAYRLVQTPLQYEKTRTSLKQLGDEYLDYVKTRNSTRHYLWPLFLAFILTLGSYSVTHPFSIQQGWWTGFLEEVIDIFQSGEETLPLPRALISGRFLFWGWLGAYIYSVHLTFRHFMAHDLTPKVYIFTANRFFLAMTVGSIVGVWLGTSQSAASIDPNLNFATVSLVLFFIGFFPEQGMNWLYAATKRFLGLRGKLAKETPLSAINGLSIWHQGRLKQEGIESAQNLAVANIASLVVETPYDVAQIIDWVDQAILLEYASDKQFHTFRQVGLHSASDLLAIWYNKGFPYLIRAVRLSEDEVLGLDQSSLEILRLSLMSAPNIRIVLRFLGMQSLNKTMFILAKYLANYEANKENQESPEDIQEKIEPGNSPMGNMAELDEFFSKETEPNLPSTLEEDKQEQDIESQNQVEEKNYIM